MSFTQQIREEAQNQGVNPFYNATAAGMKTELSLSRGRGPLWWWLDFFFVPLELAKSLEIFILKIWTLSPENSGPSLLKIYQA